MIPLPNSLRIAALVGLLLAGVGVAECRAYGFGKFHKKQYVVANAYLVGTPVVGQAPVAYYTTGAAPAAYYGQAPVAYTAGAAPTAYYTTGAAPPAAAAPAAYYYVPYAAAGQPAGGAPPAGAAPSAGSVSAHIRIDGLTIVTAGGRTTATASNGATRTIDGAIQSWSFEDGAVTLTTTTGETLVFDGRDFVSGGGAGGAPGVAGLLNTTDRNDIVERLEIIYSDEFAELPVADRSNALRERAREMVADTLGKGPAELTATERRLADSLAVRARSRARTF